MSPTGLLALVDFTAGEILLILVGGLIILGPERLPEVARTLGEWMAKLRRISSNLQHEMRDVLDDPAMQPLREVGEFVAQPRKKLTELALNAEAEAAAAAAPTAAPAAATAASSAPAPETAPETAPEAVPAAAPETGGPAPDATGADTDGVATGTDRSGEDPLGEEHGP